MRLTVRLQYQMNSVCSKSLEGLPLTARGRYIEVTPRTVALRLMENFGEPKKVGVVRNATQRVEQGSIDLVRGGVSNTVPGRISDISLEIIGELFSEISLEEWYDIRPDLPKRDFDGLLSAFDVECEI